MGERPYVWSTPADAPAAPTLLGGKGANLARLDETAGAVPPWFAVTPEAFREALRRSGRNEAFRRALAEAAGAAPDRLAEHARAIRAEIVAITLPSEIAEAIRRALADRIGRGHPVAVRSSAVAEDAAADSFAGIHDSELFVPGDDAVLDSMRRVWASAFGERALAYRRERGIEIEPVPMAVIVQRMIEPAVSGVLFTANPVTDDTAQVVISALYGAGEGLVGAGLDADTFTVEKDTLSIRSEVADKTERLVRDGTRGGLRREPVPEPMRGRPSLAGDQVLRVARLGLALERRFGRPQDVEFCVDAEGALFLLQTRPVTTVTEYGPAAGNRLLWDNSNIIESYAGVTTPMTFSFIRHAYAIVYYCFAEMMGVPPAVVRAHRETFENMLGLFRGRVYYNLLNWYRLLRLFPGFRFNRRFMESMMGVRESADLQDGAPAGWARRYLVELPALVRLVARTGWNFLRIRRIVGGFEANFHRHYTRWKAMDFDALPPHELMGLYREMEEKILWNWRAPIINDFYVMIFYGLLKRLCVAWCNDPAGTLQNDLICGEGGIESVEPTRRLLAMARVARDDPVLRERLLSGDPEELARTLPKDPGRREFSGMLEDFLDRYGFRCVDELKLESETLRDRPAFVFGMIRNYLAADDPAVLDITTKEDRERSVRATAEKRAFEALGRGPIGWLRRILFRRVLRSARLGVKNRENQRLARTRIYGLLREVIRALGSRMAEAGILDERDDIFYLALEEVWDYVRGRAITTDLRGLAALRRREFDAFRAETDRAPDERFETYGMAYHRNRFRRRRSDRAAEVSGGILKGTGCSPGTVEGTVHLVRDPSEGTRLAGEILVAERTDPGWVPLFPSVSGILIERGSILSHSAIVAREMGIPTIVGIPGLTSVLATGHRVRMDGSTGTVEVQEPVTAPGARREGS